jgi:hypothetical protein
MCKLAMQDIKDSEDNRIRVLENWLQLAQTENMRHGWELDAAELERLIFSASSALDNVVSLLGAQAILWRHQRLLQARRT